MVPADSRRIPRVPRYSGGRCTARLFAYRTITFCGATFQYASAQDGTCDCHGSYNPDGLGSSPFARHYWGNHCYFLFLEVLRCFSSLRLPRHTYMAVTVLQTAGLSHSDTRGSRDMCSYPRLFAAYRVLHRLREPRHPPCALSYFLSSHRCNTNRTGQLILSAVASPPPQRKEGTCSFDSCYLQSCLCQYVKDLMPTRGGWRMSESRRHRSNTTARLYLLYTKGQKRTRSPGDDETIHDF